MTSNEISTIIKGLLQKSKQKQVNWVITPESNLGSYEEDYIVHTPNYSINIYEDDKGRRYLSILDGYGDATLREGFEFFSPEHSMLGDLLVLAKKKATKIDEILDDVEKALLDNRVFGERKTTESGESDFDDEIPF